MMPVKAAIIEAAAKGSLLSGRCRRVPSQLSVGERYFVAVDRLSRNGRVVLLHQLGYSTYQIALRSKFA